jgi:drug/metabolite transporter superfamily protein YnfA
MSNVLVLLLLALSALLEAGGDFVVRQGLHAPSLPLRIGLIVFGGVVLTGYGMLVNSPPWEFGRLLGVYVCLFFLAAQTISAVASKSWPSLPILAGGALILIGGVIITVWQPTAALPR